MWYRTVLLALLLGFCQCKNQHSPNSEALLAAIDKFNVAFAKGDLTTLDSLTTENYLHTNSSSQVIGKTNWFNYLKKRSEGLKSGDLIVLNYVLDQTKIEFHGSTAIVTGRVTVVTKDSIGSKENQYRITNLWVYKDDHWKRAGFHDGKIE